MKMAPGKSGELEGEFRYLKLDRPIALEKGAKYLLTMSTIAGDGDHFHDPSAYDGLSPIINPKVRVVRSVLFRNGEMERTLAIPSFGDLHSDYSAFRIPVGPTIRFR